MSGGIADTLAAHHTARVSHGPGGSYAHCSAPLCDWLWEEGATALRAAFAAHQAEVLSSAGYGELSALLDDLRGLIDLAEGRARVRAGSVHVEHLYPLLARYAPSDPTPKEQR